MLWGKSWTWAAYFAGIDIGKDHMVFCSDMVVQFPDCMVLESAQHLHQVFLAIWPRNYLNNLSEDSISYLIPVVNPFFLKPIRMDSVVP